VPFIEAHDEPLRRAFLTVHDKKKQDTDGSCEQCSDKQLQRAPKYTANISEKNKRGTTPPPGEGEAIGAPSRSQLPAEGEMPWSTLLTGAGSGGARWSAPPWILPPP
jgi:hypothetical protein